MFIMSQRRVLVLVMIFLTTACSHFSDHNVARNPQSTSVMELINDGTYLEGFQVQDQNAAIIGTLEGSIAHPTWQISQWGSRSNIPFNSTVNDAKRTVWANADKSLTVNKDDRSVLLSVNAFNDYQGVHRSSNQPWVHLLLSQKISEPGGKKTDSPSIAEMGSLKLNFSAQILESKRSDGKGFYRKGIHAAQLVWFFTIQNLNPQSPGFGQYLWFGGPMYDDREEFPAAQTHIDAGTKSLIYYPGLKAFTNQSLSSQQNVTFDVDILPHVRKALDYAFAEKLFKSTNIADYKVGGMNMGWEVTGLNIVSAKINIISLKASRK